MLKDKKKGMTPLSVLSQPHEEFEDDKVLYTGRIQKFNGTFNREEFLRVAPAPWTVDFQLTAVCNHHCIFCSYDDRNKHLQKNKLDLVLKTHRDLIDMGARGIIYTGGGEPLSWRDGGVDLADLVENMDYGEYCKPSLVTNAVMLQKMLKPNILRKLHFVAISVYAHTPELYKDVVKVNAFKAQTDNIRRIIQMKKDLNLKYPELNFKILINRANYKYLPEIYKFYKEMGVEYIFMRCVNNFEEGQDVELSDLQKEELESLVRRKMDIGEEYVEDFLKSLLPPKNMEPASNCWTVKMGHNLLISTLGECSIEIPYGAKKEFCIGNVNNQSIKDIWGSEQHLEVINKLNHQMRNHGCDLRMCRHHKYNKIMDQYLNNEIGDPDMAKFDMKHGYYL
ncbi:radical SAM/SPASM domain-containing protein [Paenibacillus woosongensis]|uniref:Radical SAM/SPASM domain-containing protein n=1 Tax=Paenibacillus woosongensis TaxID=307580 RepID=A0AA95I7L8_9BACL|nr:radical SAM/SPASM domain-containing protein [Paenibacillus woosongensis]WHX50781.1 radical SAM/SPASM domain-containing protein [Paenibacillus woosongensis]